MKHQIHFLITIDTECDKSADWSIPHPLRFRNIETGVGKLFQPFCEQNGIRPTYLLSPEIIRDSHAADLFRSFGCRCELGTHMHTEFIEPDPVVLPKTTDQFQADFPEAIEYEKMKNMTALFHETFGYAPSSFRAGRFGMGPATFRILSQLGYKVDSSVFPLHVIQTLNYRFNYFDRPLYPYFIEMENTTPATRLLELPMTVHSRFYSSRRPGMRKWLSRSRYSKAFMRRVLPSGYMKVYSLRPSTYSYEAMRMVADAYIQRHQEHDHIFLVMMFHSNELTPGTSPYNNTERDVAAFMERLSRITGYILSKGAGSPTMHEAYDILSGKTLKA